MAVPLTVLQSGNVQQLDRLLGWQKKMGHAFVGQARLFIEAWNLATF